MSLEAALSANTDAINKLIEVWSKLTSQAKSIAKEVADGTVTAVSAAGTVTIKVPVEETVYQAVDPKTVTTPAASPAEKATAPTAAESPSETAGLTVVTYDEVKAAILALAKAKGGPATKEMLAMFGAKNGQDIAPEDYVSVMARISELMA